MQYRLQKLFVIFTIFAAGLLPAAPAVAAEPTSKGHVQNPLDRLFLWAENEILYYFSQIMLIAAFFFIALTFREMIKREWLGTAFAVFGIIAALWLFKASADPTNLTGGIAQQIPSP